MDRININIKDDINEIEALEVCYEVYSDYGLGDGMPLNKHKSIVCVTDKYKVITTTTKADNLTFYVYKRSD